MQTVRHKIYGVGEVIGKKTEGNFTYIEVKFENGKKLNMCIPDSFEKGVMVAEGSLKHEVDAAIAEKKARKEKEMLKKNVDSPSIVPISRHGRTPAGTVHIKDSIERAFEEYLIKAGYCEQTGAGAPSTVFSYSHAVKKVLEEEGISWGALKNDIKNIVALYDAGGKKEHIGLKSNKTVINSLKRFDEFVNG
jgi:hypothetical protein